MLAYHSDHRDEGYRRLTYLTYMMRDADIVAVRPATTYRVPKGAGVLRAWNGTPSTKGQGFQQPLVPHERCHIDIAHLRIAGTFFFLCTVLDGCRRFLGHEELRAQMSEQDVARTKSALLPEPRRKRLRQPDPAGRI